MLREKVSGSECLELQKTEQDKQSQIVGELLQNLSVLKNTLEEKLEKENVINEIINPQDDLRNKDEELQNADENLESTQQTLSKEQAERELLGEQARTKILERKANKKKLYVELPTEQPQPAVEQTPTQGTVTVEQCIAIREPMVVLCNVIISLVGLFFRRS